MKFFRNQIDLDGVSSGRQTRYRVSSWMLQRPFSTSLPPTLFVGPPGRQKKTPEVPTPQRSRPLVLTPHHLPPGALLRGVGEPSKEVGATVQGSVARNQLIPLSYLANHDKHWSKSKKR